MTARARCSACGQPLPDSPVYLPPVKARIFNAIRRAGPDGIIGEMIVSEYDLPISLKTLAAHINQINDVIEPHGLHIPDARRGDRRYRVIKLREAPR